MKTVETLDPGFCSFHYAEGWHTAEEDLRSGRPANGDVPEYLNIEQRNGYADRMAIFIFEDNELQTN